MIKLKMPTDEELIRELESEVARLEEISGVVEKALRETKSILVHDMGDWRASVNFTELYEAINKIQELRGE